MKDNIKHFKLSTGEEIICEVVQWDTIETSAILIRKAMKVKSRKKDQTPVSVDPFSGSTITADSIPDDLKDYADLLIEWWPIRKQKGGSCTESVANRIFKTLRSFPSQDRKEALEKAITGGWKDIYPLKKSYKPEEPKNNHPASRVFTAKGGFQ